MIQPNTFNQKWLTHFRQQKEFAKVDPAIVEKMIYAFALLELLANSGLKFIFKGGTSLVLMPIGSNRFSVDIDISTLESKDDIETHLQAIIGESVFSSFEEDKPRTNKGGIPKAHFSFAYLSHINPNAEILLDVLFENSPYLSTNQVAIDTKWINTEEPYKMVTIPSINSILGDKLTAFAPSTVGVPYLLGKPNFPDKRIEIIKQLYDITHLIDSATNLLEVKSVFETIALRQIEYRNLSIGVETVIADIFNTALVLARRENNKQELEKLQFNDLSNGLKRFSGYLMKGFFRIEEAIAASAKVAYFTQSISKNKSESFVLFDDKVNMTDWIISNPDYNFLNKLKRTNREAFYYWWKCLEL